MGMCILRDVGRRIFQHDAHPAEYSWIIELVAIKLDTDRESSETYLSSTFRQIAWKLNTYDPLILHLPLSFVVYMHNTKYKIRIYRSNK